MIRIIFGVLLVVLSSCSGLEFEPGWYTEEVKGQITTPLPGFVLVTAYERSYIERSSGPLMIPRVWVEPFDASGRYRVLFTDKTARVVLRFIAMNQQTLYLEVNRSLGVKSYRYDGAFQQDTSFNDNFYFIIKPLIADIVTEPGYRLSQRDQSLLTRWVQEVEDHLE